MWYGLSSTQILDMIYDIELMPEGTEVEYPLDLLNATDEDKDGNV